MIDIFYYMAVFDLKKQVMAGKKFGKEYLSEKFEEFRRKDPVVYNIETTNACNMRCAMCPRTTMMTRKVERMKKEVFEKIVSELVPYTEEELSLWHNFVEKNYEITKEAMSENNFFLHVIPQVIQLHGYGDPLLDTEIAERVKLLSERGFKSYFSCNPANINLEKNMELFRNGLGYIKYSIESVDDFLHKKIRGEASDFEASYKKILKMIEAKEKYGFKTTIIITMLDLKRASQQEEFEKLCKAFSGFDVYIYLKSQDQQWYQNKNDGTNSIHWTEFCQFPWSSMTIKSNGEAAMCVEDFNNEIILGDTRTETLHAIWNGEKYQQFRHDHFDLKQGIKCTAQCDMKLIGSCCQA